MKLIAVFIANLSCEDALPEEHVFSALKGRCLKLNVLAEAIPLRLRIASESCCKALKYKILC